MSKKRVVASLRYGWMLPQGLKIFFLVVICAGFIALPFLIVHVINSGVEQIMSPIMTLYMCILSLCILLVDYKSYKIYKKSKEDFVLLDATTRITDNVRSHLICCSARISVQFYYNGRKIVKKSGDENYKNIFDGSKKAGYGSIFCKYGDRDIKILYSKKYDQVFIVKD